MSETENSPQSFKPSAMKARGGVPLPGFKPPMAGLKHGGGGGAGVPAGLQERLAKIRQQQKESEEENNNESDGKKMDEIHPEIWNSSSPPAEKPSEPRPPSRPSRQRKSNSPPSSSSSSSAQKDKSESDKNGLSEDVASDESARKISTVKSKRISNIGANLNFNPMMLRPPSSGSPTSPPSSNHNKSPPIGHPRSPPDSNPASPAPAPTPIDLNAPPPAQHTKSLLTNDAIKKRAKITSQRKPPSRHGRRERGNNSLPASPLLDDEGKQPLGTTKSLPATFNGLTLASNVKKGDESGSNGLPNLTGSHATDDDVTKDAAATIDAAVDIDDIETEIGDEIDTEIIDETAQNPNDSIWDVATSRQDESAKANEAVIEEAMKVTPNTAADEELSRASLSPSPTSTSSPSSPSPPPLPTSSPPPLD